MFLLIRRFSHRHSRTFFIPNCNPLRENPLRENPLRENPLNECEKVIYKKQMINPLNECEKPLEKPIFKYENPLNECEKPIGK